MKYAFYYVAFHSCVIKRAMSGEGRIWMLEDEMDKSMAICYFSLKWFKWINHSFCLYRKNHRALQGYLLSLHTLVPLLRNYDDIPDRPYGGGRKMSKQQVIEEYDEIGLCKRLSEIRNSKKTEDRNTVYSLQKEIFSSNL